MRIWSWSSDLAMTYLLSQTGLWPSRNMLFHAGRNGGDQMSPDLSQGNGILTAKPFEREKGTFYFMVLM